MYAINSDGTLKWKFSTKGAVYSSPAIDSDGNIYVGSWDQSLYALNSNGTLKWSFDTGSAPYSSPVIGENNTVYIASNDRLYAIDSTGSEVGHFNAEGIYWSSPTVGSDGTIYVGSTDNRLYAIKSNLTQKWVFETKGRVWSSPTIGSDGTIYFGARDWKLYAINGGSGGLADTCWPVFHHDLKHTGQSKQKNESLTLDMKVNSSDGPLNISASLPISVTISVVSGNYKGQTADWWIAVNTPFDSPGNWYSYVYPTGWQSGINRCIQTGIFSLKSYEVLNMKLPVGKYTFYFALDDPDGEATGPWWAIDSTVVMVQ